MEQINAKVLEITDYPSPGTVQARSIRLSVPESFSFKAGQFVLVGNDAVRNKNNPDVLKWASLSIASSPSEKGQIVLGVERGEEGGMRHFICTQIGVGDSLLVKGPFGSFTLDEKEHEPVFIALGCGITAVKSMLAAFLEHNPNVPAALFYSIKNSGLYLFENELSALAQKYPLFDLKTTVTREDPAWKGLRGHVQDHLKDYDFGDKTKKIFYLCGSPKGVLAVIEFLEGLGFTENQMKKENW